MLLAKNKMDTIEFSFLAWSDSDSVEIPLRKYCISFAKSPTSKLLNYLFKCNAAVDQMQ